MNPPRRRSDRFGYIFEKSDDVVVSSLFHFEDLGDRKTRSLPYLRGILFWDLAKLGHCLTGEHFNFQPDLELALIRPDSAHLRSRITVDHAANITASRRRGKRFVLISTVP